MTAIAAVDTALWDIKGKALDVPVYQLLGGASREDVMVYGHANGETIDDDGRGRGRIRARAATRRCARSAACPGSPRPTASARGAALRAGGAGHAARDDVEQRALPARRAAAVRARCARELGPDLHLLHDVHHRLTPIEAARLGKELEPYHLFWMEDPTPAEQQESFRLIRQHTTTPLAVGEVFNSIHDCQQLIQEQLIDYIRDDRRARRRHHATCARSRTWPSCITCAPARTARRT